MSALKELNESNFDAEIRNGTVLVDFWAAWCGPCRMQTPILESVDRKIGSTVKICKLNVDDSPNVAARFGIQSIPTILIFKDGRLVQTLVGLQSEAALISIVEALSQ
jgi:thioredoxin 1